MTKLKISSFDRSKFIITISHYLQINSIKDIQELTEIISASVKECTTFKLRRIRENNKWINDGILIEMKTRNRLYKKIKKLRPNEIGTSKDIILKRLLNDKQLYIKNLISKAKDNYYNEMAIAAGNDGRKIFKVINELMHNKTCKTKDTIEKITINNNQIKGQLNIANCLNKHFTSIGKIKNVIREVKNKPNNCCIFREPVDSDEVYLVTKKS